MESNVRRLQFKEELQIPVSWGYLAGKVVALNFMCKPAVTQSDNNLTFS
jgi:hypothetical protein